MNDEKKVGKNNVVLLLTGDIMLGGEFLKFENEHNVGYEYIFRGLKRYFDEANIVLGNLECPLSKNGVMRVDKGSILYAPPDSINTLKYFNYNIISLIM